MLLYVKSKLKNIEKVNNVKLSNLHKFLKNIRKYKVFNNLFYKNKKKETDKCINSNNLRIFLLDICEL